MMKKLIAICLMLMLVTASASAADWAEGLSPAKPNPNVREVDLEKEIGYMMFHPNAQMSVAGAKTLFIYLPREDVRAGSGELHLRDDDGEIWSVAFDNTDYVTFRALANSEMYGLLWGGGTCVEIALPVALRLGTSYYVDLDNHCIIADAGEGIGNLESKGDHWHFETMADYGVDQLEYRRAQDDGSYKTDITVAQAGDEVRFDLVIGGAAKCATIYTIDAEAKIMFNDNYFTESCEVIGEVIGTDPAWGILFWDEEVPPMDQNEAMQHLVANLSF